MIYVLLLQEGKFYVGYSERPVGERFLEHFNYNGSKWTTRYRPIEVLKVKEGGPKEENELTLEMMEKHGWWNVRGGSWCKVEMESCPPALLQRKGIKLPPQLKQPKPVCTRCGRDSHTAEKCYAKVTVDGTPIEESEEGSEMSVDSDSEIDPNACFRCGRKSHWERDCYAKTDIHGNRLKD